MEVGDAKSDLEKWNELLESFERYSAAHRAFFRSPVDRVAVMRQTLKAGRWGVTVELARDLTVQEHMQLFNEWVFLCRHEGLGGAVRGYVLSLPREWVLERVEKAAEPYLADATITDFGLYLDLYSALDPALALKLARRVAEHTDEEIRELGEEFLSAHADNHLVPGGHAENA